MAILYAWWIERDGWKRITGYLLIFILKSCQGSDVYFDMEQLLVYVLKNLEN